jgi:hypothetical protein
MWPSRQALTQAHLTMVVGFYAGTLVITWVSLLLGALLRSNVGALPNAAELAAAAAWLAVSTLLTTGVIRNATALLRRSPRMPVMLGRNTLLGLMVIALVAGVLESASREATSRFWLIDVMPYLRAFTLGSMACGQSARMARLTRLRQAAARRLHRARLFRHVGPTLGLGSGGTSA